MLNKCDEFIMNKLEFLNANAESVLSLCDFKVMCVLFEHSYLNISDISVSCDIVFDIETIEQTIENLIKLGYVEESDSMYILSTSGDELIETTAKNWFEFKYPDQLLVTGGRTKRPITEMMDDIKTILYNGIGDHLRDEQIKRQNFKIKFSKDVQKKGFKWIEIRNSGFIRLIVGRHESNIIEKLTEEFPNVIAIVHTEASSIKKFDVELNEEVMVKMISFIKNLCEI